MNSHAPPKQKRAPAKSAFQNTEMPTAYRSLPVLQAVWEREGARLFREYWRSGNLKDLHAFVVHVVAMRALLLGGCQ